MGQQNKNSGSLSNITVTVKYLYFHVFRAMMRLTIILWLALGMMAQVTFSGHCIHNFFDCNHRGQSEGDRGRRPVREVYSAAPSLSMSVSVSVVAMVLGRILI